ncbi:putative ATP-dependent RNA helicase [Cotonvirus japonicus]|uniref:ATP-dependent RNA helicase n=1 Tax=Cotonvirus japonicus TaxID=2811091 RepID=A0ABM7NTD8_9VIRU|nr:putative ATP-dependent RNA helicase [Cotonvirus japonicus]BCS83337.1 putative ATP-dependent RNA helicase [Cotonvirus japonicus]
MIVLNPHQKTPIRFMKKNRGIILFHSTGAGKSLTALYSVYQFDYNITIIGPKSSKKAFIDNINKADMDINRFTFYTYTKIKKILESDITFFKNTSVIVDEAHTLRNENMYNLYIASALMIAPKVILLTATPVVNYFNDLSVLVNIVKGQDVLPTDRLLFDHMFYDEETMLLINTNTLFNKLLNSISYYKTTDTINYPSSKTHIMEVEMDYMQIDEYKYYIKKIIYGDTNVPDNYDIFNINYGLLPNKKRNFFLNVTRQLSNIAKQADFSPKIQEIIDKITKGPYPIVVYSNFLKNGIYSIAVLLEKNNISYKIISGFVTQDKLNIIVNNYNNGMFKVLLLSSAGSESLDLKNTRQVHIMEPHWNESKITQVIGRSIRYGSHINLPIEERKVDIYRWISIFPEQYKNISADQYLMELSLKKTKLWNKYLEIVIDASIENNH